MVYIALYKVNRTKRVQTGFSYKLIGYARHFTLILTSTRIMQSMTRMMIIMPSMGGR